MSDPQWDNVALLMHMDGANGSTTVADEKGKVVTALGNVAISTAQSKFGGASLYFPGVAGDYATVATSADFHFSAGDFTIEMFFYALATTGAARTLASRGVSGGGPGTFMLIMGSDGSIGGYCSSSGMGWNFGAASSAGAVSANAWHHVALTRSGGTLRLFLDGAVVGTDATLGTTALVTTSNPINIGAYIDGGLRFNGYIDEVRITKGFARYTSAFTPPTGAFQGGPTDPYWGNVSLLMHMNGANGSTTFVDETGKVPVTEGSPTISTSQSVFGGASLSCVPAGSALLYSSHADFAFPGDFTVEFFFRSETPPGALFEFGNQIGTVGIGTWSTGRMDYSYTIGGGGSGQMGAATGLAAGVWYHWAITRQGGTVRMFLGGVLDREILGYTTPINQGFFRLGASSIFHPSATSKAFFDEVRITKGVARYTENFTPPTEPFPNSYTPLLIDAIASGQLTPSPLSNLLLANWPLVGVEASGALTPSGFLVVNNPQIIDGLLSGTLTPTGFLTVNNPQIIDGLLSGAMLPSGSMLVSSSWLIEAVASGRLSPSDAAHILIDNLDPGAMEFAQIVGELELYSEVIRAAQLAGKIDLFGTMIVTSEHEAQVAGVLQLIDGEASFCGCGNG